MKKLIISFFGTFLFVFFIWTFRGYQMYGDKFQYYHLDFLSTIEQVNSDKFFYIDNFEWVDSLQDLSNNLKGVSNNVFLGGFLEFLSVLIKPIQIIANLTMDVVNVVLGLFHFLFNPVFVLR